MGDRAIDWAAINADPRFRELHRRKSGFLGLLMAVSIVYYFLLPAGAAWLPGLFGVRVLGEVNVGLLLALSEFAVAWGVAAVYTRRANREFDRLAEEIGQEVLARHARGAAS